MSNDTTSRDHQAPRGRGRRFVRRQRGAKRPRPTGDWVRLASSERLVATADILDRPSAAMLVAEDACWQFALARCLDVRPRWWRLGQRREWQAEFDRLEEKRLRLVELARGVPTLRTRPA